MTNFTPLVLSVLGFVSSPMTITSGGMLIALCTDAYFGLRFKNDKIELKLLPLICYEIIYSNRLFKDKNFDYIINISEDGWFGNSIGPKQHFAHSIFRSIESGKYVIRSANNGISAIINPIGVIEKKVEFGTTGYVDFKESKILRSTLYMNYGDKIFFILILLYIFLIFSFKKITHE